MQTILKWFTWLVLGALVAAAGCAEGGYYAAPYAAPAPYPYQGYYQSYPYYSDVPPSFYNNDPSLQHWYTAPYWNPEKP